MHLEGQLTRDLNFDTAFHAPGTPWIYYDHFLSHDQNGNETFDGSYARGFHGGIFL